jgi:uncharacterized SAM-dependent methyltransferase
MEKLGTDWTDFHELRYLNVFRKSDAKIQVSLKSDKNEKVRHKNTNIHCYLYLAQFSEWEIFQTKIVEKIKTHILCSVAGESKGNLPLRICPGCSVPEPYQSPDWALVPALPA